MNQSREPIFVALFNLLCNSYAFKQVGRKLVAIDEIPPENKPCLFMLEGDEDYKGGERKVPPITTFNVELFIGVNTTDAAAPGSVLNPILDAIDQVLAPSAVTQTQTLGGLVDHVWIDGKIIKIYGVMDGQGLAVIPVKMLVS